MRNPFLLLSKKDLTLFFRSPFLSTALSPFGAFVTCCRLAHCCCCRGFSPFFILGSTLSCQSRAGESIHYVTFPIFSVPSGWVAARRLKGAKEKGCWRGNAVTNTSEAKAKIFVSWSIGKCRNGLELLVCTVTFLSFLPKPCTTARVCCSVKSMRLKRVSRNDKKRRKTKPILGQFLNNFAVYAMFESVFALALLCFICFLPAVAAVVPPGVKYISQTRNHFAPIRSAVS